MDKIMDKVNLSYAAAVTILSTIFGVYWYMFTAFGILNIVDYLTGIYCAKITSTESSDKGLKGIVKKVGYWIVIAISFFIARFFADLGKIVGFNFEISLIIGWFTLGTFIINEMRSILENLVIIGVKIPKWLIRGLEIADKRISGNADKGGEGDA